MRKLLSHLIMILLSLSANAGYGAKTIPLNCSKLLARGSSGTAGATTDAYFRQLAKDQWQYYADNVNVATNYLPPDNVKIEQDQRVVNDLRTSPTNIGLYMLSTMAAHKMGFINMTEALARLRQTVQTIKKLPKYTSEVRDAAGKAHPVEHLYNWYSIGGTPAEIGGGFISTVDNGNLAAFLIATITAIGKSDAKLVRDLQQIVEKMRFDVLYDPSQNALFHGAQVKDGKLHPTAGHYDMLISEARSAYAVAIMLDQIPASTWTNLKRKLGKEIGNIDTNPNLMFQSYTGTMFEYLTPSLFMRHKDTPLGEADIQALQLQMADKVGGVWGKSEANSITSKGYAAWGVRALSQSREFTTTGDQVVAPYASQMAAGLAPLAVSLNLQAMDKLNFRGKYGQYESATAKGSGEKFQYQITPQFYAHHVGMGFVGIANHLQDDFVVSWFHGSIYNKNLTLEKLLSTPADKYRKPSTKKMPAAGSNNAYAYEPKVTYDKSAIIGNGDFVAYVPGAGGSTWLGQSNALTHNEVFYIRDNASGELLPLRLDKPDAIRSKNGARYLDYDIVSGQGGKLKVTIEISVSSLSKTKVTRVIIDNQSGRPRDFQITGYVDWIMGDVNAYLNHAVYRNLYTLTELDPSGRIVTARRRTMQGAEQDQQPYGFFALGPNVLGSADWADGSRLNVLGRLGGLTAPQAVVAGKSKGRFGATLDPAGALSKTLSIGQGKRGEVSFVLGSADDKGLIPNLIAGVTPVNNAKRGVPNFPPDGTFLRMKELFKGTSRGLRIKDHPMPSEKVAKTPETMGHFSKNGKTFVIEDPSAPKKPWSMVVSNGKYGFVATHSGWSYGFGSNSQQTRVTPYAPDITSETPLRGVLVKDKITGEVWSMSINPAPAKNGEYKVEVSPGSIKYKFRRKDGLAMTMTMFVAQKDPVEFWQISVKNDSNKNVDLELSSFIKWAMGANYPMTAGQTKVKYDAKSGAILVTSPDASAPESVAFHRIVGGDSFAQENNLKSGIDDPFAGLTTDLKVASGQTRQLTFMIGLGENASATEQYLSRYNSSGKIAKERKGQDSEIDSLLSGLQVQTPDKSLDVMLNTWMPYQAYYAHYLARSGFYQSGGAYGFRDQLQTVMNMINSGHPHFRDVARKHILESTRHQFEKGDVQHWWHPHNNLGQRSTISDNLLWLPLAISHYIEVTGDDSILKELTPFSVASRELKNGELDFVEKMPYSANKVSVYEHAKMAIALVLTERMGEHGLPLMGKGDWNDGLDRVGHLGKGESVWLGFFLYDVLNKYAGVAKLQNDITTANWYLSEAAKLKQNLDQYAWNDEHYIRAFADSGEKIDFDDAIVQAWAVLSKGGEPNKAKQAIDAAITDLYKPKDRMIILFDRTLDKETWGGSLAAYPPGLRENQAQYTHGTSWLPRAVAELGEGDKAMELFMSMLPTTHANDPRYGAEPYAVAADIYGGNNAGEGGWTWYSGAAGWLYRTGMDTILGLQFRDGNKLFINPTIPSKWPGYSASYKNGTAVYQIQVVNPDHVSHGVRSLIVDGESVDPEVGVTLIDDGKVHMVQVIMG